MALPLSNNADGGAALNGTALVAATGGNTGGASGDFFDIITPGTSQTWAFDTAVQAGTGGASYKHTLSASTPIGYLVWSTQLGTLATGARFGGRIYIRASAMPTATGWSFLRIMTAAPAGMCGLRINSTGTLQFEAVTTATGTASAVAFTAATWYRVEFDFQNVGGGATAGIGTANIYAGDSTTVLGTASASGVSFGTVAPAQVRLGLTTASGLAASSNYNLDDIVVNSTGAQPGPASRGGAAQTAQLLMPPFQGAF